MELFRNSNGETVTYDDKGNPHSATAIRFERLYPGGYAVIQSNERIGTVTRDYARSVSRPGWCGYVRGANVWTFYRNNPDMGTWNSEFPHGEVYNTLAMAREHLPRELGAKMVK